MTDLPAGFSGPPRAVFRQAEAALLRRRAQPPDMRGAVAAALAEALCGETPPQGAEAAAQSIAAAVVAHANLFLPENEPAYHNQYHQAEATIAMGWLCATARRLGRFDPASAAAGVLAMAGHDLLHDGSVPPPGTLEARSADRTTALAAQAGLDAAALATIRRVILATDPARTPAEREGDDLLCRLAQEADLFGSLTPELGWRLSQVLAREVHAAGYHPDPPFDSFRSRLHLLRLQRPATSAGKRLGLDTATADQIAALAALGDGDAERGATALDARTPEQARADYLAALAAAQRE